MGVLGPLVGIEVDSAHWCLRQALILECILDWAPSVRFRIYDGGAGRDSSADVALRIGGPPVATSHRLGVAVMLGDEAPGPGHRGWILCSSQASQRDSASVGDDAIKRFGCFLPAKRNVARGAGGTYRPSETESVWVLDRITAGAEKSVLGSIASSARVAFDGFCPELVTICALWSRSIERTTQGCSGPAESRAPTTREASDSYPGAGPRVVRQLRQLVLLPPI